MNALEKYTTKRRLTEALLSKLAQSPIGSIGGVNPKGISLPKGNPLKTGPQPVAKPSLSARQPLQQKQPLGPPSGQARMGLKPPTQHMGFSPLQVKAKKPVSPKVPAAPAKGTGPAGGWKGVMQQGRSLSLASPETVARTMKGSQATAVRGSLSSRPKGLSGLSGGQTNKAGPWTAPARRP